MTGEFFQFLYEDCQGEINIRPIPGGNEFYSISQFIPEQCIQKHKGKNLYFGVATRDGQGGGKQNIVHIPALFIDVDLKETPREALIEHFKAIPLKPSAIVETGGGFHLYWKLKEPLEKDGIPEFENYLLRIATYFEADLNAIDASRILRVPGSQNHKYKPPKTVILKQLNPDLQYKLEDFDFLPEAQKSKTQEPKKPNEILEPLRGVSHGNRNATCAMLAGHYLAKRLSEEEVIEILLAWNLRNKPPLEESEIIQTVESVKKTDARNHPITYPHITQVLRNVEAEIVAGRKQQIGFDPCFDFLRKTIRAIIPTHLWLIGGYTSHGKTAFIIDLLMRLLKQKPSVAVFSVEMSAVQYALRMLGNQTGIPSLRLLLDQVSDEQNAAIHEAFHVLNRANIYLFDDVYEFKRIADISSEIHEREGLDIIVIDFIQNLLGRGTIYDRMSKLAPELQALAKKINGTVIALSQVSNEAVKENLEVIGFKGAGELAAAADLGIWLERKKEDRSIINAIIRKNRHGPAGAYRSLQYDSEYTRFKELEPEDNYYRKKFGTKEDT